MTDENFDRIEAKLDIIIRLLAKQIVGEKTNTEAAPYLHKLGLSPSEIASILDSTPGAVSKYVSEAKKKGA